MSSAICSTTFATCSISTTSTNQDTFMDVDLGDMISSLEDPCCNDPTQGLSAEQLDTLRALNSLESGATSTEDASLTTTMIGLAGAQYLAIENTLMEAVANGVSVPGFYPDEALLERKIMAAYMCKQDVSAMQAELDALRAKNRAQ